MKIAVEGCAHGELERIYNTISLIEKRENFKVDLLICCGDFQSTRNEEDLACMACPPKYRDMCTFYKYYSGEKEAPVLTLFIGGNHEASSFLQELAYGGWVAPNIFYLGYAGVVNFGGIRIGGISGIQKGVDYLKGHFEKAPYTEQTKRSCYHIRNLEIFRLKQLSGKIDVMCSHDWPQGVYHFGNSEQLARHKPYFKQEMEENKLGSSVCEEVLKQLKPSYWFSAHLHTKFSAIVPHPEGSCTKFLALDKCLPRRRFLQLLDIEPSTSGPLELKYDQEWLTILFLTNHLLSIKSTYNYLPGPNNDSERYNFTPTQQELNLISNKFSNDFTIPHNFTPTAPAYNPNQPSSNRNKQAHSKINPITRAFCETLCVDDPLALLLAQSPQTPSKLNDSYGSFQSTTPSALSTPSSQPLSALSSARKFKLSLPSPKNISDCSTLDDTVAVSDDSCILLDDSNSEKGLSLEEETKLMSSVKKFTPYRSKLLSSEPKFESPLASELPRPLFPSPLSNSPLSALDETFPPSKPLFDSPLDDSYITSSKISPEISSSLENETSLQKNSDSLEKVSSDEPVLIESENLKPVVKKFKRRNQSIYQSQDDE